MLYIYYRYKTILKDLPVFSENHVVINILADYKAPQSSLK